LHLSRLYQQFSSFLKENCFAPLQCVRSSYCKICDEEVNLRYEGRQALLSGTFESHQIACTLSEKPLNL